MKKIVTSKSRPNIKGHQEKSIKIQLEMIKLGENKFKKKGRRRRSSSGIGQLMLLDLDFFFFFFVQGTCLLPFH
jgi:hypothetical protein